MTEAAIKCGSRSRTNEAHATLTELGEKRIIIWNCYGHAFRMKKLGIVQTHSFFCAALDAHSVGVYREK
jgi:hypothetical protein